MNIKPFFSVIVVCFNAESSIRSTIDSILSQTCGDLEIIVKDGLSTDNTLEQIPNDYRIKIYSEKDFGIYDAMNQATHYASGKYIIYMNCGDLFYNNSVLEKVKNTVCIREKLCVYGDVFRDGEVRKQSSQITNFTLYRSPICHQSIFFEKSLLNGSKTYNTRFQVDADYDLEIRLHKSGTKYLYIETPICKYEGQGFSEKGKGAVLLKKEKKAIRKVYFTAGERFLFEAKYQMTLPWIRKFLFSQKSPPFIRKLYRKLANVYYEKAN